MNFDGTLIMKNGTKIPVAIDYIETTVDTFPKFEGHVTGTAKVSYRSLYDIRNDSEVNKYCYNDVIATRDFLNSMYGIGSSHIPEIKNVIFNDPATIVFWEDGTKTVVKCQDGDEFDPEKGLAMAIAKKAYGNKGSYCNKLKKWLPKEEPVDTDRFGADLHVPIHTNGFNGSASSIFVPKVFPVTIDSSEFLASFKKGVSDALDIIFKGTKYTPDDNNVSSKKRMTFREEVAKLRPERIDSIFKGGVCGCPRDIDTCPYLIGVGHCPSENDCRACWDREIPDDLMDND